MFIFYIIISIITKHSLAKGTKCSRTVIITGKIVENKPITSHSLPGSLPIASICAQGITEGDVDDSFSPGRMSSLLDPGRAMGLTNSTILVIRIVCWWLDRQGYSSRLDKSEPPWPH